METKFYICKHCGNIVALIRDCGVPVQCCGEKMQEITPETSEGSREKHLPVCTVNGETATVSVGETEHPMTPEHYIEWVCLESEEALQIKKLNPKKSPKISFSLSEGDKVRAVYAFCNQHSLWKA